MSLQMATKKTPRKKVTAAKSRTSSRAAGESPVNPGVNPAVEHDTPEHSAPFPIVAVGASAGGIEAFQRLLKATPADTGMAFVMILHLPPNHSSLLSDILGRVTAMPVFGGGVVSYSTTF